VLIFITLEVLLLIHLLIGNAFSDLNLKEEAIKDYSTAIKLDPKNPNYYFNRGTTINHLLLGSALSDLN
jgi:serine/threonine-protein kinase